MTHLVLLAVALPAAVGMAVLAVMRRSSSGWGAAGWASGAALCLAAAVFGDQLAGVFAHLPCSCAIQDDGPQVLLR